MIWEVKNEMNNKIGILSKFWRCVLHIPVGVLNAGFFLYDKQIGWAFLVAFMIYELVEDYRIKDFAHIDVIGWLWGFGIVYSIAAVIHFL